MSPARFNFCSISSTSDSVMSFSDDALMISSTGMTLPSLASNSPMSSFITIILFRLLAGMSVAILSTSNVPVFSSKATSLRQ